jgi:hypothetical protein
MCQALSSFPWLRAMLRNRAGTPPSPRRRLSRTEHDFVAQAVVNGLMRVALDTGVPILSVSLTPHHFQPTEHHIGVFARHFVEKGREAAQAALLIGNTRAALAA